MQSWHSGALIGSGVGLGTEEHPLLWVELESDTWAHALTPPASPHVMARSFSALICHPCQPSSVSGRTEKAPPWRFCPDPGLTSHAISPPQTSLYAPLLRGWGCSWRALLPHGILKAEPLGRRGRLTRLPTDFPHCSQGQELTSYSEVQRRCGSSRGHSARWKAGRRPAAPPPLSRPMTITAGLIVL